MTDEVPKFRTVRLIALWLFVLFGPYAAFRVIILMGGSFRLGELLFMPFILIGQLSGSVIVAVVATALLALGGAVFLNFAFESIWSAQVRRKRALATAAPPRTKPRPVKSPSKNRPRPGSGNR